MLKVYIRGMKTEQVFKWLKEHDLRIEDGCSIFDVSFSTLQNGSRGARLGKKTLEKIQTAIQQYSAKNQQTRKAG